MTVQEQRRNHEKDGARRTTQVEIRDLERSKTFLVPTASKLDFHIWGRAPLLANIWQRLHRGESQWKNGQKAAEKRQRRAAEKRGNDEQKATYGTIDQTDWTDLLSLLSALHLFRRAQLAVGLVTA